MNALSDLEKAWKGLMDVTMSYQRSEVNPQFVQVVSPTDVVVVVNFEIEVEYSAGMMTLCFPYATLEPIREKLQAGFQSEQMEVDTVLAERFKKNILHSSIEIAVELGSAQINARDIVHLQVGDVIPLQQDASEAVTIFVEGIKKFKGYPAIMKSNQVVQISDVIWGRED